MFAIPMLLLSSCGETVKDEIADVIIISQDNVAFSKNGGAATIGVACPSEWHSAALEDSWITTEDADGKVIITVSANYTGDSRKGTVTLASATCSREIKISQSWMGTLLSLDINGPEEMELDSEGDSFKFSVETSDEWTVKSDASWLTVIEDGKIVSVNAASNDGAHRNAVITVTASAGDSSESKEIKISQISRDENVYFKMLGRFGLYAERWYYGGNAIDAPGIGTYCTIEQKEYGKTFTIKDLFVTGTECEASYDKETKQMALTLGNLCMTRDQSTLSSQTYWYYYLVQQNFDDKKFESGIIYGTMGTATDGVKDNCDAILLSGFDEEYGTLGLIVKIMPGGSYAMLGDTYYADGKMYLVRADKSE